MWSSASSAARPVYLREVAEIIDGGEEPTQYVFYGHGLGANASLRNSDARVLANAPTATAEVGALAKARDDSVNGTQTSRSWRLRLRQTSPP